MGFMPFCAWLLSTAAPSKTCLSNLPHVSAIYAAQVDPECPGSIRFDDADHFSEHSQAVDGLHMETAALVRTHATAALAVITLASYVGELARHASILFNRWVSVMNIPSHKNRYY
jgi:hypothetical protein